MGVGSAAEPEMLTRRFDGEMASRVAVCISGESVLWLARRRL